jgi:putative tryptophan/tyrosine transport system substrate-binding protein
MNRSKQAGMAIKTMVVLLVGLTLASVRLAEAQQPKKVPRIGYLAAGAPKPQSPRTEAFRQGLRALGYIEGQSIIIEYRFADTNVDRLPELAAELVSLKVDLIVAENNTVSRAALGATTIIPIVMASGADPVATGLVASLARPGGNVTGLTNVTTDLAVKRLELLKEIVPKLHRVAVLWSSGSSGQEWREMQTAAPSLQFQLQILDVRSAEELEKAFNSATKAHVGALTLTSNPIGLFSANQKRIIELAAKNRLPAIYPGSSYVDTGGLMSYAANNLDMYRRAATYVDKILKGAKPADLPVEQPMKFEFVVNLKTAKQLGLIIPPNVLVRADRVIR